MQRDGTTKELMAVGRLNRFSPPLAADSFS